MRDPIIRCPAGHIATSDESGTPECLDCELIATHYNREQVFTWTPRGEYENNCRRLQDQIDAAFDHQYFGDW